MAEELGKIEKPESGQYANRRKLYLVPLMYSWSDAPEEYRNLFEKYWQQVREHLSNLESKMGTINRVYHEAIGEAGEKALEMLEKISPATHKIVKDKIMNGAQVEALEDMELVEENMDWERHLMIGFLSQKVARAISDMFAESTRKRYEHIAKRLDETFQDNEAAVIFIREGHRLQFPSDIEVFSVAPPALNDIQRWLRDRGSEQVEETREDKPEGEADDKE